MRLFAIAILALVSSVSFAKYDKLVTCSGFTTVDQQAMSFVVENDAQDTGDSATEIAIYIQDLTVAGSPNNYLGPETCVKTTQDSKSFSCLTDLGETYSVDLVKMTGNESGADAQNKPYSIDYPTCK